LAAVVQVVEVEWAHTLTLAQLPPGLAHTRLVYLQLPTVTQSLLLVQGVPVAEQMLVPDVGQSAVFVQLIWLTVQLMLPTAVWVAVAVDVEVAAFVSVTVFVLVTVWVMVLVVQVVVGTEQVPGSCGQSVVTVHWVTPSFWQMAVRQSASDWQTRPHTLHRLCTPPLRQFAPLSQSTPASDELANRPPGTPVIEPEVSSTTSMLALWSWRSMIASGLTRAWDSGGQKQAQPSAATRHATRRTGRRRGRGPRRRGGRDCLTWALIGGILRLVDEPSGLSRYFLQASVNILLTITRMTHYKILE
jgi:hypothetical protein